MMSNDDSFCYSDFLSLVCAACCVLILIMCELIVLFDHVYQMISFILVEAMS